MGKSAQAAAETHKNIVTTAAAEFRARGFDNVGLAELMAQCGLTHGGFYRHFENKDQLITEACEEAFKLINVTWPQNTKEHSFDGLKFVVSRYLSSKYRDHPEESCAFVMLGSDIARASEATKTVATEAYCNLVSLIEKALPHGDHETMNKEASFVACSLIGTLSVARLVADKKLSKSILTSMKERILSDYAGKYPQKEPLV
jgi:TetR/AcrR family transcriptional repressor of nem operon